MMKENNTDRKVFTVANFLPLPQLACLVFFTYMETTDNPIISTCSKKLTRLSYAYIYIYI